MRLRFYGVLVLALGLAFALPLVSGSSASRRPPKKGTSTGCCSLVRDLPATQLGGVNFGGGAMNVVLSSDGVTAYACGPNEIAVIDISNPSVPQFLAAIGSFGGNGEGCYQVNQSLVVPVNNQSGFVYDISNSRNVKLQSQFTPPVQFTITVSFLGNVGWFSTAWFNYNQGNYLIFAQHGEFAGVDFTNPASPVPVGTLSPDSSQPDASTNLSPRFGSLTINGDTAYVFSTTATGGDPNGGQGAMQIVNISNPAAPVAQSQLLVPQATVLTSGAVQGNVLLVTGNTKGWRNPGVNPRDGSGFNWKNTGVLTLSAIDVTEPYNPAVISTSATNVPTWTAVRAGPAPLGNGFFVVSVGPPSDDWLPFGTDPRGQLLLVDARDPTNLGVIFMGYANNLGGIAISGSLIYAATGDGLAVFQLPDLSGL